MALPPTYIGDDPVARILPGTYYKEIGRIVHKFAFCEMMLLVISYDLMRVGRRVGRIAVRRSRVDDQITMLQDLESVMSVDLKVDWSKLKELLKKAESYRDCLIHGMWLHHPSSPVPILQQFSYSSAETSSAGGSLKARIDGTASNISLEQLRNISNYLEELGDTLLKIQEKAAASTRPKTP